MRSFAHTTSSPDFWKVRVNPAPIAKVEPGRPLISPIRRNHASPPARLDLQGVEKEVAVAVGSKGGYVLEGSVRKGGGRVRITAQLNDTATGSHVWAERYDRDLADVFAVQDEITEAIVAAIEPQLYAAADFRAQRKPPDRSLSCGRSRTSGA